MPLPLREPTELGCIGRRGGQCRAEFRASDSGRELRFEGPYRDDEDVAQDDLLTIRAAGERMARTEALQAMESQSIFMKSEAANEAGGIQMKGFEHRARMRCLDHSGGLRVIQGPCRLDARRAQADLERIRAAAASQPTRADDCEAMAEEAHRLQAQAAFEVEVAMSMGRKQQGRQHMQTDSEPESDQDATLFEEPFPYYDMNNPQIRERLYTAPLPRKKRRVEKPPTNEVEATLALAKFAPSRSRVEDLRILLEARADPNATVGVGNISPLRNVVAFAHPCNVREMRLLLLDYGAVESSAELKRWENREEYDMMEPRWLAARHRDDREG